MAKIPRRGRGHTSASSNSSSGSPNVGAARASSNSSGNDTAGSNDARAGNSTARSNSRRHGENMASSASASNPGSPASVARNPTAQVDNNEELLQFLRQNSSPLANNIRLTGSPRSAQTGPRQAIIIVKILHKPNGIHAFLYGFRRLEEPTRGSYVEKIHRDQVCGRDQYLMAAPLNILKTTYGWHENGEPILNEKGYELSAFVAVQNFENKTEQNLRELARVFATAVKQHIERDPNCQNQQVVVNDANIYYNENSVFMDFIGERNAVNLYRTILPVDSTPGYSQFNVGHARSFFRTGTLSPQSVALIKSDNTFLVAKQPNENAEEETSAQNPEEQAEHYENVD